MQEDQKTVRSTLNATKRRAKLVGAVSILHGRRPGRTSTVASM